VEYLPFKTEDTEAVVELYYDTVHEINSEDYSPLAIEAWAPEDEREEKENKWRKALEENYSFVAKDKGKVVGFADIDKEGYLDRIYVHKDYQGEGIASVLLEKIENKARKEGLKYIHAEVSISAKEFFEFHGYQFVTEEALEKKGVSLIIYRMLKNLEGISDQ